MFSDTFAGIAPNSVPPFIAAQLVGATVGVLVVLFLYPMAALEVDVSGRAVGQQHCYFEQNRALLILTSRGAWRDRKQVSR